MNKNAPEKQKSGLKIAYSSTNLRYQSTVAWNEQIFMSKDPVNCPITDCLLYLTGCVTPITGITNMNFINRNGKLQMNANSNSAKGWVEKVCIVCTNGQQQISVDNFEAKQGNMCENGFKSVQSPLKQKVLSFPYDSTIGAQRKLGNGYQTFFQPIDEILRENCVLQNSQACALYQSDCKTAYKGGNVILNQNSPYQITASTKSITGYSETLCFSCITSLQVYNTQILGA